VFSFLFSGEQLNFCGGGCGSAWPAKIQKNCPAVKMLLAAKIEFWEVIKIDKIRSSYLKIRLKLILD
jgi:hypothetical protein